jgi:hypothetical protein
MNLHNASKAPLEQHPTKWNHLIGYKLLAKTKIKIARPNIGFQDLAGDRDLTGSRAGLANRMIP